MRHALRLTALAAAAATSLAGVAGCGNAGGDTACGTFRSMSSSAKDKAITKMLQDKGQTVTPARVEEARLSATAFCFLHSSGTKISGIYG